ncbi:MULTISPECIES: MPN527 family putative ECF transporter permease subunit [unclassified Mycoplasma]|uniref:MPN527 family putative ECF transporter permease subunit n=1 Tax=unclassified Mycoplasma TaxID=2683645 RepID=UPI00211CFC5A|nr:MULTISPECIES: hypothetical protein [unclassified Mycoplasma]UUM19560.1 hypothetical protein NPA11_02170 [Mycoplasma sp. 1578d]UUM24479.1 hypothetical protein NPA12_02145 [Mycoplasma sp. 3686d]
MKFKFNQKNKQIEYRFVCSNQTKDFEKKTNSQSYIRYGINDYRDISKIVTCGLILALALIFSAISKFTPNVFSFLQFNFSLIPILFGFYVVGWKYGLAIIFINFLISPLFSSSAQSFDIRYIGQFNLLILHLVFVFVQIYSFKYILKFVNYQFNAPQNNRAKLFRLLIVYSLSISFTVIFTTLFLSTANTFFINLVYFKLFFKIPFSLQSTIQKYPDFKFLFLNINNYFAGSYTLYIIFNIMNLSLNLVIITLIWALDWKTRVITNLKHKHNIFY